MVKSSLIILKLATITAFIGSAAEREFTLLAKIMKSVFILQYEDLDGSIIYGIYSTREKAIEAREKHAKNFLYLDIKEKELDKDYSS